MLACLDADNRLDPADVEDLSTKIRQSKYASDLASRIRTLVQHPRVSVPRLDTKGNGMDLNTVAEYLDNTLASDKIADFERNCIDSDVRLAEVAACHQVLVLVLEQPAEIDPALRERMYRLGAESSRRVDEVSETRPVNGGAVRIDRPATAGETVPAKPPLEVPEYLRAGRKPSLWPLAIAAVLAFIAVGVGLRLMGPLDRTHPMAQLLTGSKEAERNLAPTDPPIVPETTPRASETKPVATEDQKTKILDNAYDVEAPAKIENRTPVEKPEQTEKPNPPEPETTTEKATIEKKTEVDVPVVPEKTTPKVENPVEPPQPPPADVARFVSEDQVLVRRGEKEFVRVPARASIFAGDELFVFPTFRPQILAANNVQITVAGEARFLAGMSDKQNTAHLNVDFGRFLLNSVGKANAKVMLSLGNVEGVATFTEADAELALEVRHYLPPGANPEAPGTIIRVTRLYSTRGKIAWQEGPADGDAKPVEIESGHVRNYVGEQPGETVAIASLPEWIDGKNILEIERRAAREMDQRLAGGRSLELTLTEMADASEKHAELRSLAVRALATLGHFEPILATMADESQRIFWPSQFDSLREAVSHSPELAAHVHETYVKVRGAQDGGNLFRMVRGFSPEDLKTNLADELVKSLDFEVLDYRVLAFENLRRITGSTQLYQPQFTAQRRKTPVAQWRERLKNGEIVYKVAPAPIMEK
jgi:hypothetical protein